MVIQGDVSIRAQTLALGALEQAVAAATPFGVALAALWHLPAADHGRLAVMGAGVAAGLALHTALVLDPLTARGRVRPATVGSAVLLWAGLAALLSALAALLLLAGAGPLTEAAAPGLAAAAGPALLTLARRTAHLRRRGSLAAGAPLAAVPPTVLLVVGASSAEGYLLALTGGAAVGGGGLLFRWARWPARQVVTAVVGHHRRMGGWLLLSAGPWVVATQAPLILLAALHGEEAAGALRAVLLLALPVAHLSAAVGTVVQPRLADAARHGDVRRSALRWGGGIGLSALPWVLLLVGAPQEVIGLLPGEAYVAAVPALPIVALAALLGALGAGPALALRAARRTRPVALAAMAGAGVALAGGLALVPPLGVAGAAIALLLARAADVTAQAIALRPAPARAEVAPC